MAKESQEKVCLDCGDAFTGNPRARYCPRCRELRKAGTTFHEAKTTRPGPFKRLGAKIEPIKKYLSFWRLVTINIILLVVGFICVWYLKNEPYSYETQQRLEAFATIQSGLDGYVGLGNADACLLLVEREQVG